MLRFELCDFKCDLFCIVSILSVMTSLRFSEGKQLVFTGRQNLLN